MLDYITYLIWNENDLFTSISVTSVIMFLLQLICVLQIIN